MNTKHLKECMKERNLSQAQLGEAVGVSHVFIGYVLRGQKEPSVAVLKRIAQHLEVTMDELA